jgi:nitrous oxidase accessory protein NosD
MKRLLGFVIMGCIFASLIGLSALSEEIHLPDSTPLSGTVLIAESFYEQVKGEDDPVPIQFEAWQNGVMRPSDWFDVRIEAHPGDVIILASRLYTADLWVFVSGITITTEPDEEEMAEIWGTVEIDADGIILDRIAVTGSRKNNSSGHGIEVNREVVDRITIRNCLVEDNEWMGIHVIGPRGEIREFRVENCEVLNNGSFGIEVQGIENLTITGCTVTGNSEGVHIGSNVLNIEMSDNAIYGNRLVDVYQKDQ